MKTGSVSQVPGVVLNALDEELAYMNTLVSQGRADQEDHGVAGQLVTLSSYTRAAQDAWVHNAGEVPALDQLRKVAAIAIRALALYGCPRRIVKPLAAAALSVLLGAGCASFRDSFKATPEWTPLAPPKTDVSASGNRIRVVVYPGDRRPYCGLPDAGNVINCEFTWDWLQRGDLTMLGEGWRSITPRGARAACASGFFTAGIPRNRAESQARDQDLRTCGWLLMHYRVAELAPDDTPAERR